MRGNSAEEERDAWTQPDADEHCRRCEASLVGLDQRAAQAPLGGLAPLQLDGNCGAAVRHHADRRVTFRRDDPEASDKGTPRCASPMESNLRAMDESAANAPPMNQMAGPP